MNRLPRNQILLDDALKTLRTLPAQSVDQVITSPPYFRLRDYQMPGQLGLETSVDKWVANLLDVIRECGRLLVPTGTLWLNLGDTYSTGTRNGAARKSLLLGPERLAIALVNEGWTLRNKIVWAKTNTVPTSVRDRLATKHEVIYVLSRSPLYFFNLDAIRVPHTSTAKPRKQPTSASGRPAWLGPNSDSDRGLRAMHAQGIVGHPLGKNPGDVWAMSVSNFRGAHFATYPVALVERMLKAGCPERRCVTCKRPWVARRSRTALLPPEPTCACGAGSEPGVVLDPFMGAGSTAAAARRLGRDWLGIELSPDFRRLALKRLDAA